MKLSMMAGATLALVVTASSAQTQLEIFGTADVGLAVIKNGRLGSAKSEYSGSAAGGNSSSRIGLRGREDLGDGWGASFHLESSVNFDTGTSASAFWDRRATVALASRSLGEMRLGRDYIPTHTVHCGFDFGGGCLGLASPKTFDDPATSQVLAGARPNVSRANNSVQYILPDGLGGLRGAVLVAASEGVVAGKVRGARLGYRAGSLDVAAAMTRVVNTPTTRFDDIVFGAAYDFGVVRVAVNQRAYKWGSSKQVVNRVLLTAPVGQGLVRLAYMKNDQTGPTATLSARDAKLWAVAYVHHLSKRTALYAASGQIANKGTGTFVYPGGPAVSATASAPNYFGGGKSTGTEFGLRHNF